MRPVNHKNDPAPSRWSYRYQRLMLTPEFRNVLRIGLPFCLTFGLAMSYLSDQARQERLKFFISDIRQQIETRPEFMVNLLAVEGANTAVEEDIREIFPVQFPISSFDLELDDIRLLIKGLPAVADANVRVRQGGVLVAEVTQRQPVAMWRSRDGLWIIDRKGVKISELPVGRARVELPVVAGEGAQKMIPEALEILQATAPLGERVHGLVRIGERRWDVVLDRDQRIMLPEKNPVPAVERVIVLNDVQDMLERDLVAIDMRLSGRPTIRMNERAVEDWWRATNMTSGAQ